MFMVYNTPGDLNSVQACTVSQQLCLQAPSVLDNHKGPKYPMMKIPQCNELYFSLSLQVKMWN